MDLTELNTYLKKSGLDKKKLDKVAELAKLCSSAIENGCGDAVIQVQADADGISDIMINGVEGWGNEFHEDGPKVLSLVSVTDKQQFERIYGSEG